MVSTNGADAPPKPKAKDPSQEPQSPKTTAPEALAPSEADYVAGEQIGLSRPEIDVAAIAMLDYWRAKGERRSDWHASLRTWLRNAPKFDKPRAPPNGIAAATSEPYDEVNDPDDIMPRTHRRY